MYKSKFLSIAMTGLLATGLFSCNKNPDTIEVPPSNTAVLTGDVTETTTLTADKVWTLKGYVYVKSGAVLNIEAGTIIKGDLVEKGALIVETGGQLMANGTEDQPIVFTSGFPIGQRRPGDWGGIILLGDAPTNRTTNPTIEGGVGRTYGGNKATDNSGTLKYVRIEFAGVASAPGSEINGLTLGGVGSGTTIENVMVSFGNDDGYEFFGGTVNCKNLIAYSCLDDDFDFDFGYTGKIQNAIALKSPYLSDPGDASNGIECDNDGTGTTASPATHPRLSNFTIIGPNKASNLTHNNANRWRRATHFTLRNSILMAYPNAGFSIESDDAINEYIAGTSEFKNNIVHAFGNPFKSDNQTLLTNAAMQSKAMAQGCSTVATADDVKLTAPFRITSASDYGQPDLSPAIGSPAASGADFSGMDAWFTATTHIGAIGSNDWTINWTNWDPNNADY